MASPGSSTTASIYMRIFQAPTTALGALAIFVLFGSLLHRVPINGWGSLVWFVTIGCMAAIRRPFAKQAIDVPVIHAYKVRTENVLQFMVWMSLLVIPTVHLLTGALGFANYQLPDWAPLLSLWYSIPGLWLFYRSHKDLGRNFSQSTEIREGHMLVTTGIYSYVRHPMYSALAMVLFAYPLMVNNLVAGVAPLLAHAVLYAVRVPYEEAMLVEQFGDAYRAYCKRTGRLWPVFLTSSAR